MRVFTWKEPHVAADQRAAAEYAGVMVATLVREPDNFADPSAIQIWIDQAPIGYLESWEAAHFQPVFACSEDQVRLPVRRSRRVKSPHFDVFVPDPHGRFEPRSLCEVCKALSAESRDSRYGSST